MGYPTFLTIKFLQNWCCCIVKRYDNEENKDGWYRRNAQQLRRLELAKQKLDQELDLEFFISINRITHFLNKIMFKRR